MMGIGDQVCRWPGGKQAVIRGQEVIRPNPRFNAMPVLYLDDKGRQRESWWLTRNLRLAEASDDALWARYCAHVLQGAE